MLLCHSSDALALISIRLAERVRFCDIKADCDTMLPVDRKSREASKLQLASISMIHFATKSSNFLTMLLGTHHFLLQLVRGVYDIVTLYD